MQAMGPPNPINARDPRMALETLYYITQIIAVAAVVASLIFVGVQIKQQRDDARLSAMRDVHKEWRDLICAISSKILK